jgi:SPX domain protein involved in polyphosphate accumulation
MRAARPRRSFRLKAKHVTTLMRGELDLETHLEKLRAGGASAEDVARTRTLAAEVGKELHSRALAPALRTVYYRTAFQLASSNAVRVSLDTQLRMLDERDAPPGADGVHGWCRRPDAMPPLAQQQVVEFPFAVLEIKLQDQAPDWVEELLASGRLVQCTKFSKFLHGACALFAMPHCWRLLPSYLPYSYGC